MTKSIAILLAVLVVATIARDPTTVSVVVTVEDEVESKDYMELTIEVQKDDPILSIALS